MGNFRFLLFAMQYPSHSCPTTIKLDICNKEAYLPRRYIFIFTRYSFYWFLLVFNISYDQLLQKACLRNYFILFDF